MNALQLQEVFETTQVSGPTSQNHRQEALAEYFNEAVSFVRSEVLASIPLATFENAEAILSIHSKNWRPVYNHVLTVH